MSDAESERRKRRRVRPGVLECGCDGVHAGSDQQRRESGYELLNLMISLFATQKISARDFCTLCWHANIAGVGGGDFSLYAVKPDKDSGAFQEPASLFISVVSVHVSRGQISSG